MCAGAVRNRNGLQAFELVLRMSTSRSKSILRVVILLPSLPYPATHLAICALLLPAKMDWLPKLSFAVIPLVTWLAWFLLASEKNDAIPTVGLRRELFAHVRTTVRNMQEAEGLKNLLHAGYHKVSRNLNITRPRSASISSRSVVRNSRNTALIRRPRPLDWVTLCFFFKSHCRRREGSVQ